MKQAKIIAVVNQKGGVGKTTTVINVGAALARLGHKTLLVDLDPQGNMSAGLNIDPADILEKNAYQALVNISTLAQNTLPTSVEGLFVVPSDNNLAGAEIELVDVDRREFRLKQSFTDDINQFDFVLLDCPPSLGLLTLNALAAATHYLIPMQSEFFSLQGMTNILRTTSLVKQALNPTLDELGILITMFDPRSLLSKQVYRDIKMFAGNRLFANVIPRRVKLAESTSHGVPGVIYDPACMGSKSYVDVAEEIILRLQGQRIEKASAIALPPDPLDRILPGRRPSPETDGPSL